MDDVRPRLPRPGRRSGMHAAVFSDAGAAACCIGPPRLSRAGDDLLHFWSLGERGVGDVGGGTEPPRWEPVLCRWDTPRTRQRFFCAGHEKSRAVTRSNRNLNFRLSVCWIIADGRRPVGYHAHSCGYCKSKAERRSSGQGSSGSMHLSVLSPFQPEVFIIISYSDISFSA